MATEKGEGSRSESVDRMGSEPSLEELLECLNLKGEDIEGVFVAKKDVENLKEETKWMAVMRLQTTKPFSATSLKKTLRFAWAPAQEVSFRDIEGNRFLVQASCLGDWKRITEQGPWLFRDYGLLVEKYDGSCRAGAVELNRIHAWARIYDVPELYRRKHMIMGLAESIGQVLAVDMNGSSFEGGDHVRIRVWLDVRKPLTRFVSFKPEGSAQVIMRVKYEKIARYCAICGLLGHEQEECGSGEHAPGEVKYGKWLLADTPWNRSRLHGNGQNNSTDREYHDYKQDGLGRGRGRGAGYPGRGNAGRSSFAGGRGRGGLMQMTENRKRTSTDASLTEVSPTKGKPTLLLEWKEDGGRETGNEGAKQMLEFQEEPGKNYEKRDGTPPPPPSAREQKRPKKQTPKKDKIVTDVAASGAEGRQSK
jgi:hypothetical protein